ncbi:MAG: mycofactocin precursor MftA [Mycobacterium sp.]|nr:mycofactocin precursor MftA [Mycobacterium sp.]
MQSSNGIPGTETEQDNRDRLVVGESLIEEVSIDGMCGVY